MEIVYKKLTETELETFIDMRITQLTEEIEYYISKCMYVEMFAYYGIRPLCKIFCNTDRIAYSGLTRHVKYVRHSDLSDGCACCDEIFRK